MNITKTKTVLLLCSFLIASSGFSQFAFSVSPGSVLNGACFGWQVKKFVPYLGIQLMSGGGSYTETGKKYDSNIGQIVDYKDEYTFKGSVFIPTLGAKYFFAESGKLKAYGNLNFSRYMVNAKITDSNDPTVNDDLKEFIDKLKVSGAQLGFGTEYFFDDNFSLGGEFGFRFLRLKSDDDQTDSIYDPNSGNYVDVNINYNTKINVNPSYIKFALNFYFNGK